LLVTVILVILLLGWRPWEGGLSFGRSAAVDARQRARWRHSASLAQPSVCLAAC